MPKYSFGPQNQPTRPNSRYFSQPQPYAQANAEENTGSNYAAYPTDYQGWPTAQQAYPMDAQAYQNQDYPAAGQAYPANNAGYPNGEACQPTQCDADQQTYASSMSCCCPPSCPCAPCCGVTGATGAQGIPVYPQRRKASCIAQCRLRLIFSYSAFAGIAVI